MSTWIPTAETGKIIFFEFQEYIFFFHKSLIIFLRFSDLKSQRRMGNSLKLKSKIDETHVQGASARILSYTAACTAGKL